MKRPLCLFVIVYVLFSFFVQLWIASPRGGAAFEASVPGSAFGSSAPESAFEASSDTWNLYEGTQVCLTGRLHKKEVKNDRLIYYLKEVQILEPKLKSNLKSNQRFNEKQNLKKISFYNRIRKSQEMGAVCYMEVEPEKAERPDSVSLSEHTGHPVGRWLCIKGASLPFEKAENEGQFDAAEYYGSQGYHIRLWNSKVVSSGLSYDNIGEKVVDIKHVLRERFQKYMTTENAGVLSAMLLGDKTSMEADIKNLYRKSGIAHVLAISGLHISLLGMLLYRLMRRLYFPPPACSLLGMFLVLVYIKVVGFGISSFRAVCMFLLYMLADLLRRTYDLRTALAFSAFLLLLDDPGVMFQAGFLLSFLAVLALAVVDPILQADARRRAEFRRQQRRSRGHPAKAFALRVIFALGSNLLSGFSVQVFLFPITLWFYYEFPLCSFILNLIVIPCMSVVLVCGLVGAMPLPGCFYALYPADWILSFYEWLCRLTELFPETVLVTGRPMVWQMVIYYAVVILWLFCEKRRILAGKVGVFHGYIPRFVVPLFCMLLFLVPVHRENRIDMLSVGQGDCVCLRDTSGHVALVDGGSTDVSEVGKYRLVPFLKYNEISEIDVVFLSHAHEDHYSAIAELLSAAPLEGVRIKTLCLTEYARVAGGDAADCAPGGEGLSGGGSLSGEKGLSGGEMSGYQEIISLARAAGVRIIYLSAGDRITCGKMEFCMVYPETANTAMDENDRSMILLASLGEVSMLFTGDSSSACDEDVIRRLRAMGVYKIHCLKVAHHGAKTSTSTEFLEAFDFDVALISCGAGNSYGHPHSELLERLRDAGCEVFVTPETGQVTLRVVRGPALFQKKRMSVGLKLTRFLPGEE